MNASEIGRLEASRREAMLAADVSALADLLADEVVWIHASSKRDTKISSLREFATGALRCSRLDHSQVEIRIYGPTALVTGVVEMEIAINGENRAAANRYTAVWADLESGSRLVLWQSTRLSWLKSST
jgi:ketosteroid isomerase-like protein